MIKSLKNMFAGGDPDFDGWNVIDDPSKLQGVLEASRNKPQLIYKHSNRCSVCWFTKAELERASEKIDGEAEMYFVDVIRNRSVSNTIAEKLGIRHESPQAILVENGEIVWHASHGGIKESELLGMLAQ